MKKFINQNEGRFFEFRKLLAAETFNTLSSSIVFTATPLIAVTQLNATPFEMGLLAAAGTVGPLLFGLSAGALADRLHRGRTLFLCGVARLMLVAVLPLAFYTDRVSMTLLCSVSFGLSVIKLIFDSIVVAAIPTIVKRERLAKANGWLEAANSTAYALGPALAGWLVQSISAASLYLINMLMYLISTFALKSLRLPEVRGNIEQKRSHFSDVANGIRILWNNEIQRAIAMAAGLFNLFHTAFFTVFILFALKELEFGAGTFGLVMSVVGLSGLLGALCAPKLIDVFGVRTTLVGSLLIIGPLGLPITLAEGIPFFYRLAIVAACLALWDFMIVLHVVVEQTLRQAMVRNEHLSRITATTRFISWGADPVGAMLGGALAGSAVGSQGTLLICLLGLTVSGAVLLASRGIRKLTDDSLASLSGQS
jgi:predicted MFS family arabinose efflux permease